MTEGRPKKKIDGKKLKQILGKRSGLSTDSKEKQKQFKEWLARAAKVGPEDFNLRLR